MRVFLMMSPAAILMLLLMLSTTTWANWNDSDIGPPGEAVIKGGCALGYKLLRGKCVPIGKS